MSDAKVKGDEGERKIIDILKNLGFLIRRPDLIYFDWKGKKWYFIEVKNKEPFEPPPDYMQGIPKHQYDRDIKIYKDVGVRTILVVRGKDNEWLAQFIDKLIPESDPRPIPVNNDVLVWFSLKQFIPLFTFLMTALS